MRAWSRRIVIPVAVCVAMFAASFGALELASSPTFQVFGGIVHRVETDERVVALTFDDGPVAGRTEEILAILARQGVAATFFVIGEEVAAYPEEAAAIVAAGHQLGNHSWSHARLVLRSPAFVRSEVDRGAEAIRSVEGSDRPPFRPPYGKKGLLLPLYLRERGIPTITWDVAPDSADASRSTAAMVEEPLRSVRPGSIVVLHPWYPSRETSFAAIEPIVEGLRADGYTFVTIDDLRALRQP